MGKGLVILGVIVVVVVAIVVLMPGFFTGLFNSTYDHDGKEVDATADSLTTMPGDWFSINPPDNTYDSSLYPQNDKGTAVTKLGAWVDVANVESYQYKMYSPNGASGALTKNIQLHILVYNTTEKAQLAYSNVVSPDLDFVKYNKFQQAVKKTVAGGDTYYVFRDMNVVGYVVIHPGIGESGQSFTSGNADTFMVALEKKIHDAGKNIST